MLGRVPSPHHTFIVWVPGLCFAPGRSEPFVDVCTLATLMQIKKRKQAIKPGLCVLKFSRFCRCALLLKLPYSGRIKLVLGDSIVWKQPVIINAALTSCQLYGTLFILLFQILDDSSSEFRYSDFSFQVLNTATLNINFNFKSRINISDACRLADLASYANDER